MEVKELGHTVAEVSKMLRCTTTHVQRHIRSGRLRAINTGKGPDHPRWLILDADLLTFLEAQSTTGETTNA